MTKFLGALGINKPDLNDPTVRLQEEIKGMELKRDTLISTIQSEINAANQKINEIFMQIGSETYEAKLSGAAWVDSNHRIVEITAQKRLIKEKEVKIEGISARYNDEIGMLNAHLRAEQPVPVAAPAPAPAPVAAGGAACANCGAPYIPGTDAFCINCGNKLG